MEKREFLENMIFYLYKDRYNGDVYSLKKVIKGILQCEYENMSVHDLYAKIINYQIKKYGNSLYTPDIRKR